MKTTFATVLKNKSFSKIWLSQLISTISAYMLNFILVDRIYQATNSTVAVGLLWGFFILPSIILGPFVGVFLDYLDKKKILVFSSLIQAVVVLFYLGVNHGIWPIYTIVLLYSLCDEFFNPAISVLVPSLVGKKQLPMVNSILLLTGQSSIVTGFLAGGLILKLWGQSNSIFILTSVMLLLAALLAHFLDWTEPAPKKEIAATIKELWQELIKGYQFIKGEIKVIFPIVLLAGLQIILSIMLVLIPSFSIGLLSIDFADSSYVIILPAVLGAIVGSLITGKIIGKVLKRVLIINGLSLVGISIFLFSFVPPFFTTPAFSGILFAFLMGIGYALMYIPLQILIQENTPFDIRGRVFGTLSTLIAIATALPLLGTVTVVDIFGVRFVLACIGIGIITLAIYAARGKYGILPTYHRS